MAELFSKAVVVGLGRLGGSLAMAMKKKGLAGELVAVDHDEVVLKKVFHREITDHQTKELAEALPGADLVVLAVPLEQMAGILGLLKGGLPEGCLVMETSPVKLPVEGLAKKTLANSTPFLGAHPLVEMTLRGFDNALPGLFSDSTCVLVPYFGVLKDHMDKVRSLWEGLKCNLMVMDATTHDRVFSLLGELPTMVIQTLLRTTDEVKGQVKDPKPLFSSELAGLIRIPEPRIEGVLKRLWAGREVNQQVLALYRLRLKELSEALKGDSPERLRELLLGGQPRSPS